jgi:hypothetical protein
LTSSGGLRCCRGRPTPLTGGVSAHGYVSIFGGVYVRLVVICTTTAAPRCRVPVPKPLAKNDSWIGYGPRPGIWRKPW